MPLRALGADVIVAPVEDSDFTPGGIIIPEASKKNVDQGIVVWIGPDVLDLKTGDHVIFNSYSGDKVAVPADGTFIILPEEACLAVYHPSSPDGIMTLSTVRRIAEDLRSELQRETRAIDVVYGVGYEEALSNLIHRLEGLVPSEGMEF